MTTFPRKLAPHTVARLVADTEPYLSCDDCFDQSDAAVEDLLASSAPFTPAFAAHIRGCGVCHEEGLSLAELTAVDYGLTVGEAVARFERAAGV